VPIEILMMGPVPLLEKQLETEYVVHQLWKHPDRAEFLRNIGGRVRAMVTSTPFGEIGASLIAALPKLEIIANWGVGFEQIDLAAAKARGIVVTNTAGASAPDVAEMAFGLLLDVVRGISANDRHVRAGLWLKEGKLPRSHRASGRPLGIVGLGHIGLAVAKRAAGFDMPVSYHNRRPRPDVPYKYVSNVVDLAHEVDFLVIATTGGADTFHLIDQSVLDALGPNGILINIARGTVVDEKALVKALVEGKIGGAGLDVFENEPEVPPVLFTLPNVVLQPHKGGNTHEGGAGLFEIVTGNLRAYFAGKPVVSSVY
jgi:hydroxypyruvate reductase